ncbi:MAG: HU family DNA-binding protein [Prevotella sp.]|nr:HU family DNA-binding protein [Prevotella sp.]
MGKITIQNLASVLVERNNLKQKQAASFVNEIFFVIQRSLDREKLVKVKGLGTFKIIDVEDRESVNVNTGERVLIEGHNKISFTPDSLMKELVNKPFSHFETVVLNDGVDFSEVDAKEPEPEVESDADEVEGEAYGTDNDGAEGDIEIFEPLPFEEEEEAAVPATSEEQPAIADTVPEAEAVHSETEDKPNAAETITAAVAAPLAAVQSEVKEETPKVKEETPKVTEPVAATAAETPETEAPQAASTAAEEPANDDLIAVVDSPAAEEEPEAEDAFDEDEADASSSFPWKWVLALLAALVAGVAIGYYLGSRSTQTAEPVSVEPVAIEQPMPTPIPVAPAVPDSLAAAVVTDTAATQKPAPAASSSVPMANEAEKPVSAPQSAPEKSVPEKSAPEKPAAEKPAAQSAAAPAAPVLDKYELKDSRIRTGAYRIVGLDHQETVCPGDNLTRICKRTIGPGMECYLEAYNDLAPNTALKAGTKVKIPKLELKKKKSKK